MNFHTGADRTIEAERGRLGAGVDAEVRPTLSNLGAIYASTWPQRVALGAAAGLTGAFLHLLTGEELAGHFTYLTFYPGVAIAALFGGLIPGAAATLVGVLATHLWFAPLTRFDQVVGLVVFVVSSLAVSGAAEWTHRAWTRLGLAERALRQSEAQVRYFVENAPISIAMLDRAMTYVAVSRRWIDAYGQGRSDLLGRSHYSVHPDIPERWREIHQRVLKGEFHSNDDDFWVDAEGRDHWVRWASYPWIDAAGEIGGVIIAAEDIAAQKLAEAALRESEEKFRNAFAEAAIGFVMARAGDTIVDANAAFCRLTGYSIGELRSMRLVDLVHPDDRPDNLVLAAKLRSGEISGYVVENRYLRKDGEAIWVRKSLSLTRAAGGERRWVVNLVEDVTERRRSEETAQRTVALLTAVLDGAKDAVISIDASGVVHLINATGLKMFGYRREEVVGQNLRLLIPDGDARLHDSDGASDLPGVDRIVGVGRETEGRRKGGALFPIDLAVVEVVVDHDRMFVGFVRDLSERRRIEGRIDQLASQRLTAMGGMAGALAHELNQPLAAIGVYLETARRMLARPPDERPARVEDALGLAIEQVMRMGDIINHLRDFVAHGEPDKTHQSLHALVRDICSAEFPEGKRFRGAVALRLDAPNDNVLMDKIQIGQVLLNLLRNAREALADSSTPQLTVSTSQAGADMVRCNVSDNGPGLADEVKEFLFEPLTSTKATGMGIGLSISKSIIEAHYGRIWAESDQRAGTTFSFTLPLATAEIEE